MTAGASAPEELVQDVITRLRQFDAGLEVTEMDGKKENIAFRLPAQLRTQTTEKFDSLENMEK